MDEKEVAPPGCAFLHHPFFPRSSFFLLLPLPSFLLFLSPSAPSTSTMRRSQAPSSVPKPGGFRPVTQTGAPKTTFVSMRPASATPPLSSPAISVTGTGSNGSRSQTAMAAAHVNPAGRPQQSQEQISQSSQDHDGPPSYTLHSQSQGSSQASSHSQSHTHLSAAEIQAKPPAPISQAARPQPPPSAQKSAVTFRSPVLPTTPKEAESTEDDEPRYFNIVWRKVSNKKHKSWDGDCKSGPFFFLF